MTFLPRYGSEPLSVGLLPVVLNDQPASSPPVDRMSSLESILVFL